MRTARHNDGVYPPRETWRCFYCIIMAFKKIKAQQGPSSSGRSSTNHGMTVQSGETKPTQQQSVCYHRKTATRLSTSAAAQADETTERRTNVATPENRLTIWKLHREAESGLENRTLYDPQLGPLTSGRQMSASVAWTPINSSDQDTDDMSHQNVMDRNREAAHRTPSRSGRQKRMNLAFGVIFVPTTLPFHSAAIAPVVFFLKSITKRNCCSATTVMTSTTPFGSGIPPPFYSSEDQNVVLSHLCKASEEKRLAKIFISDCPQEGQLLSPRQVSARRISRNKEKKPTRSLEKTRPGGRPRKTPPIAPTKTTRKRGRPPRSSSTRNANVEDQEGPLVRPILSPFLPMETERRALDIIEKVGKKQIE